MHCIAGFLSKLTDGSKLRAHVYDHDDGHDERDYVYEARRAFEYDRICQFNRSCVACCLYARSPRESRRGPNEDAQW